MIPLGIGMFVLNRFGLNKDSYALVLIFGTVLFTAVISHMTFRWIEKPGQRLGAKLSTAWFARPSPSKPFALGS
jgi:peptidoglycan/LPS O-acetylase OafA/YrhL